MSEPKNEELEFNVGDDEQEATVEMNEDGSDAKLEAADETPIVEEEVEQKAEAPKSEELDNYSDKVKKRIDKLTARLRETQRREEAAIEYAKSVQQQNEELQQKYTKTDTERLGEVKSRVETQVTALKHIIKKAREEGDIDTETEAQQRLTAIVWEQQQLTKTMQERELQAQQPQQPRETPEILQPRRAEPDPRAEEWAENNPWFGQNTVMTHAVWGLHKDLIQKEGFDPTSNEYYDEIDRRMRTLFPQEFQIDEAPAQQTNRNSRPVQTVAPANRSSGINNSARRSVRLKPSQVAIAKKLGVPLEEYAKYVKE
jgi:hypothetical protein